MSDEPDDSPQPAPEPQREKPYSQGPLPGGSLPDPGKLFQETLAEFTDNMGPYAMAGLGHTLVVMPVTFVGVFVVYFVVFGGMFGVMIGGAVLSVALSEMLGETAGAIGIVLTQILSLLVPAVCMAAAIVGLVAVLAPINASVVRAVAAHQRGEAELDFMAAFSTVGQDVGKVIGAGVIMAALSTVGLMMCIVPALLVPLFLGFATSFVAMHGTGPVRSFRMALRHTLDHLSWHMTFGVLFIGLLMIASYIPVIGPIFATAFHVRAYRELFGDGSEPELIVA